MRSLLLILLCSIAGYSAQSGRCVFYDQVGEGYTCRLEHGLFDNPDDAFVIQGVHLEGRSNQDVKVLFTANSTLNYIPLEIFDVFENLEQILIHDADLRELSAPWRNCRALTTVRFTDNNMPFVPRGIFEACQNVTTLSFINSSVFDIDPLAFNLFNLHTLEIQMNRILFLHPDTFESLGELRTLVLENNGLFRLHPRTFSSLHKVETINLNGNNIDSIEPATFLNLPSLQSIYVNDNPYLTRFEPLAFALLPNLEHLSVRGGNLSALSIESFLPLPKLRTMNLRGNDLGKIERNFFDLFPNLETVDFRENDCANDWFRVMPHEILMRMEECFHRYAMQGQTTTTTTQGASAVSLSVAVLALTLVKLAL